MGFQLPRKERIVEEAATLPTLEAHRRRTEALMALSEARAAATAAKDEQDQAQPTCNRIWISPFMFFSWTPAEEHCFG